MMRALRLRYVATAITLAVAFTFAATAPASAELLPRESVSVAGTAGFFGSTGNLLLNRALVDIAPTPSGAGYWLLAGAGAGAITTAVFGGMALEARADYEATEVERVALAESARYERYRWMTGIAAASTVALGAAGTLVLLSSPRRSEASDRSSDGNRLNSSCH